MLAPIVGGGNDDALGEGRAAGGGEEAINIPPHDAVVFVVAFALDGVVFVRAVGAGDEVNAGILGTDPEFRRADFFGPVAEEPHIGIEVGVTGLKAEVGADQFLKVAALFPLGLGGGAVIGEDLLEGSHWESGKVAGTSSLT